MDLISKDRGKKRLSGCATALSFILALAVMSTPSVGHANPEGGVVVGGQASIQNSTNRVDIHQVTNRAVIDWRSFDIAPDETTQFHQPSAAAIALNRVKNSTSPSRIDGTLQANGNVIIVNQNGVLFGQGAKVDVNGLVATSADIDNDRFMADEKPHFNKAGSPDALIKNEGRITAKEAGLVGFVAPSVENNGVIQARLGRVQLSSGETTTIDFYGDGLLEIGIGQNPHAQHVKNTGTLKADGGVVAMTAQTGAKVLGAAIEQRGVIQAQTVQQKNGRIVIAGLGRNAVKGNVAAAKGKTDVAETAVTIAGTLDVAGKNAHETAGSVEVVGDHITLSETAKIDARGYTGGGDVKVGGDYLGLSATPVAKTLNIKHGAEINASATTQGDGGRVIAFADEVTDFDGIIRANGAGMMGDGGFVETSGKSVLRVDKGWAEARGSGGGKAGEWLLDPADITIDNTNPTANVTASPNFQPNAGGGSFVRTTTIVPLLNAGTNVTIQTNNDAFAGNGDIFVNAAITSTGAGALTLSAFRNIQINSAITLQGGALTLRSNNTGAAGGGAVQVNGALTTNGGDITIGGGAAGITTATFNANGSVNVAASGFAQGNATMPTGVRINAAIDAGGGNILINGRGENGTNLSPGIEQVAGNAISTSGAGTIRLNGIGQGTAANGNETNGVVLRSTVNAANGVIQISGTGGGGTAGNNFGVLISVSGGRVRTTGSGNITVSGTAGNSTGTGGGVLVNFTGGISPTGTGTTLVYGSGGTGTTGSKYGVGINSGGTGSIVGAGATITVNGFGGTASTSNNNYGVWLSGGGAGIGEITNSGGGGGIGLSGTGGGTGASANNHGIFITGTGARSSTSGSGGTAYNGTGGNASGTGGTNHGIYVNVANGLGSTGTSNVQISGARGGQATSFGFITDVANGVRIAGAVGNVTLTTDTISLNQANNIVAPGTITVGPRTAITMGVGSGAGALQFTDTFIGYLTAGTGYTFGNTTALSLDVNTAAANLTSRALTLISNANIGINSVLNNLTSLTTQSNNGATNINSVIGGVTPVGAITMTGRDLFINQNMTSNNNISGVFTRDITLAPLATVQNGTASVLTLRAANNSVLGVGNLTLNGILRVGTGALNLTSGANGTRPSWTANATNLVRQGATFGAVTIQGFLDTIIDRSINSTQDVSITSFRDLTTNATHTISTGGTNSLSLRAANGNPANVGVLSLNGITSVGTGGLTLVSGTARPNFTATNASLVRQGATFGALDIQGFNDFVVDRVLNSTAAVNFSNNIRTVLRNNISSSGGAVTLGNAAQVDEGFTSQITTTNQAINLNAPITGTAGGGTETLTVNAGTNTVTVGSGGGIDGVDLNITGGSIAFNSPIGAVTGLGATTLTSTNAMTLSSITATTLTASTTGANQALLIGGALTTTQAGGALNLSSNSSILKSGTGNITTNNGPITMNAATNLMFAANFNVNSNGGLINLTGASGIINAAIVGINSAGGNVNVNSPLVLAAPLSFNLGTGDLAFSSTINGASPFASVFDVLTVGAGGGGGGRDGGPNGGGGGSGGVVDTQVNAVNGLYTILVGGGGTAGVSNLSSAAGGAGGLNGGGAGGAAGPSGLSGGGGGGGGYSGIRIAGTYYAVGGGGAGGGGANEGTANDVQAPGGGSQPNGNTGTMNGGNGANFVGDGGGGGGGGGGFLGGQGQINVTGSGQASGGSNYFNAANPSGSIINGNNGQTNGGGAAGGAAVALSGPRATFFNYANNAGAGGTGNTTPANGGNGIVVIRYTGAPGQSIVQGGTVTTIGGDTLVTFTSPTGTNFFAPIAGCSGSCDLTINANSVTFGGAVGGTQALDDISITTTQGLTVPSMTVANSLFARTTGATADITIPAARVLTANGTGNAITLAAGRNFVNNSGAGAVVAPTGRYLIYSTAPANDTIGGLTNDFRRFSCDYNSPGTCAFNPTINTTVSIPATGDGFLYRVTPPTITITPSNIGNVTYGNAVNLTGYAYNPLTVGQYLNATDFAADVITGSLNGSTTYIPGPVNGGVGTYNIDYASGSLVSALGYTFTYANNPTAFNVVPRSLTPSLIGLVSKTYDGNTAATLAAGNFSLASIFAGDDVGISNTAGTYDTKNVGINKNVTVTGLTLTGAQASNYTLASTSVSGLVGRILQRALTVSATGINKIYDGTTAASVTLSDDRVAGDVLTLGFGAASFADPNAGVAKPVNVTGITVTGADSGNYTFNTTTSTNATINKATVTATAQDQSIAYGDAIPAGTILYSGFVLGEDETILDTLPTVSSTLSGLQNVGIYNGNYTVSGGFDNNYNFSYVAGRLIVGKRDLNITANNQSVTYGTSVPVGTLSYSGFVTGEDETDLLVLPTVSSGLSGIQNVGTYTGNYTVSGGASDNYNLLYFAGDLIVTKKDLNVTLDNKTINFGTVVPAGTFVITGFVNGDDEFDIDTLPVAASALSGVQNAGTYAGNYTASGGLDNNYSFLFTPGTLTVNPVGLNVTVNQQTITYGDIVPTTTITYTGFVNGDDEFDLVTIPTIFSGLSGLQNAGTYVANYTASGGASPNYIFNYIAGDLVVNKKDLNVTAENRTITYGDNVPSSALIYSGFITGEDETDLITLPTISSALSGIVNVGTYNGNYTVSGGASNNYNFVFAPGNLIVSQRTLIVSAVPQNIQYGTAVPTGSLLYSGFITGEDETNLTTLPSVTSALSGLQPVGTYANNYTVSGGSSPNYNFSYVAADLVVGRKLLVISAQNQVIGYGTAVPAGSILYSGFIAGEDETDLLTLPTLTSSLSGIQNAGSYIGNYTVSGAAAANYDFQYNAGNLTVNQAPLSIVATPVSMIYGAGNNFAGFTPTGLVLGETIGSVSFASSALLSSSGNWRVGSWIITPSAATGGTFNPANYNINYITGSLNVAQRVFNVTGAVSDKIYDGTRSATAVLSDDRVAGDAITLNFANVLFDTKNVGVNKLVVIDGIGISGADAANYSVSSTATAQATITPRALIVGVSGVDKIFDGTTAASVVFNDNRVAGDVFTVGGSASFADAAIGNNKPVTVSGIFLSGLDAGNYTANTTAFTTANILDGTPPPPPFVPTLPPTVVWTSQNQFGGVLFLTDDGVYATPAEGYMLVYLPREAPELNRRRNRPVTAIKSF
jgi:trimeric autotransporter adhesin